MSTLPVVEQILRETRTPMSVREIVEYANGRLPTRSKTPDTVVARDLSMDIKRNGEGSAFARTAPGRYTMRCFVEAAAPAVSPESERTTNVIASTLRMDRAGTLPAPGAPPANADRAPAGPTPG